MSNVIELNAVKSDTEEFVLAPKYCVYRKNAKGVSEAVPMTSEVIDIRTEKPLEGAGKWNWVIEFPESWTHGAEGGQVKIECSAFSKNSTETPTFAEIYDLTAQYLRETRDFHVYLEGVSLCTVGEEEYANGELEEGDTPVHVATVLLGS